MASIRCHFICNIYWRPYTMINSLERRVRRLESLVRNMRRRKFEGGAAGHMSHIYDYTELTLADLKDIIINLFSGKVEDITEKLDGMNIQCTLNNQGKVVFIRNKGDLNSETGGMSRDDVAAKWAGRDNVANVYLQAYDTIEKVFKKIGKKFFNPNPNTKILANCECITAGKTNIIMYANAQVDFHNLWVYTREDENSQWQKSDVTMDGIDTLERACDGIDGAQLTPRVMIRVTEKSNSLASSYTSKLDSIFGEVGCSDNNTIDDYRRARFTNLCNDKYQWILTSQDGMEALYNRWFNDDKSTKLPVLKKMYSNNLDDLNNVDYKSIVTECMKPLDTFFARMGNAIIALCDGMVNAGAESAAIDALSNDLEEVVNEIRANGSDELKDRLTMQLDRLSQLGNQLNASEGIVFKYGDRLMKLTGSFASVNQVLGLRFKL